MAESFSTARVVWLASYPRSGNTFLRIVLEKIFGLKSFSVYRVQGQDFRDPSAEALDDAPYLPADWRLHVSEDQAAGLAPVKTHDAPEDSAPAIFVVRDGRAAIDSYFHYHRKFAFEQPSLTEMIAGACQFGSWSEHFRAWQPRTRAHTLLLKYEQLVGNPAEAIRSIADFLQLKPGEGRLPTFEELKSRFPAFFRRGANADFLTQWAPAQIALFNQLHGATMQELGYELTQPSDSSAPTVPQLAASASRLHKSYLHELYNHGLSSAHVQQLTRQLEQLKAEAQALRQDLAHEKELTRSFGANRWVKLGKAVGLVPPPEKGPGRPWVTEGGQHG